MSRRALSRLWPRAQSAAVIPEQLLDSLDEAVLVVDNDEHILYGNRRWHALITQQDSAGRPFGSYLHPADQALWRALCEQLQQAQRPAPIWLRIPSGAELRWCELRAQPLQAPQPWPVSLTLCDITPQVRVDQIRAASHRSLTQLVGNLPLMLYRARNNRHWSMEYVSDGCLELTGYSADALVNQPRLSYGSLIHPEDAGSVWQQVQDALHRQCPFELHYRIHHADGQLRQVSEKGCGLYSDSGAVLGVEGVIFTLQRD